MPKHHGRRWVPRTLLLAGLGSALLVVPAPDAFASCHAFTVSASPATVAEGGIVTVTVTRDGSLANSSVQARTVNGTATAGQDFAGTSKTISFTGNQLSKTFTIATINDTRQEGAEAFRVELSNGGGCTGSGYVYGPPATVTISANDVPKSTASPLPASHHRSVPSPTTAGRTTTSPTASHTASHTANPTSAKPAPARTSAPAPVVAAPSATVDTGLAGASSNDSGGASTGLIVLAVVLVAAALGGSAIYLRRRGAHL